MDRVGQAYVYCAAFIMEFHCDAGSTVRQGHTLVWLCGCYRLRGCVIGTGQMVLLGSEM